MAAIISRRRQRVDYKQLNDFTSADMYETKAKRRNRASTSDMYVVEGVISAREGKEGQQYLIKWKDWPVWSCSWEPEENLNSDAIRSYSNPGIIANDRVQRAAAVFSEAVLGLLKSKSVRLQFSETMQIDHDIMRYVLKDRGQMSPDNKFMIYGKEDFSRFGMQQFWDYYLDELGQGVKVYFPMKLRLKIGYTSKRFVVDGSGALIKAPVSPLEKVTVIINRRACTQNKL